MPAGDSASAVECALQRISSGVSPIGKGSHVIYQVSNIEAVIYTVNCTIELFSFILCVFLVAASATTRLDSLTERTFRTISLLMLLNVLSDLVSWVFTTGDGLPSYLLCQLGNNLTYYCAPTVYTLIVLFCYMNATPGRPRDRHGASRAATRGGRILLALIVGLYIADIAMVVANYGTGWIYRIGAANAFTWGPLRTVPDNLALLQFLLLLPLLLLESSDRALAWREWLTCAAIPVAGLIVENVAPALMLVYPSVTLSLLLIYIDLNRRTAVQLMARDLELAESRTKVLSGQIRSHFIFNSLAAIQELCAEDPLAAQHAIDDFSRYLRGSMQAVGDTDLIPFETEVQNVKSYLALEQIDPTSSFTVEWALDAVSFRVPPLTVQPLVENAVTHGVSRRGGAGAIRIASREEADGYVVTVEDNGGAGQGGASGRKHNGIALENVRKRLELQCGGTLELDITEDGAHATVTIPKKA